MTSSETLRLLQTHRDNLAAAPTFEEYRKAQLQFIDCLIEREKSDAQETTVKLVFKQMLPTPE